MGSFVVPNNSSSILRLQYYYSDYYTAKTTYAAMQYNYYELRRHPIVDTSQQLVLPQPIVASIADVLLVVLAIYSTEVRHVAMYVCCTLYAAAVRSSLLGRQTGKYCFYFYEKVALVDISDIQSIQLQFNIVSRQSRQQVGVQYQYTRDERSRTGYFATNYDKATNSAITIGSSTRSKYYHQPNQRIYTYPI